MTLNWNVIKEHLNLEALEDELGLDIVSVQGSERLARCPLSTHPGVDTNPSFSINSAKLVYHCFSCNGGGTIPDLVRDIRGCDYNEALGFLRQFTEGSYLTEPEDLLKIVERELYFSAEPVADQFPIYNPRILDKWIANAQYGEGLAAWNDRRVDLETINRLKLGYDPSHQATYRKFGVDHQHIGPVRIIPIFFEGILVGYQRGWIDKPEGLPKYTNTKNLPKKNILYNYDQSRVAAKLGQEIVVVESPITTAFLQSGNYGLAVMSVATFGASVTDEQINLLRSFPKVYLAFDNDNPGKQATERVAAALQPTNEVYIMPWLESEKSDLNDAESWEDVYDCWIGAIPYEVYLVNQAMAN